MRDELNEIRSYNTKLAEKNISQIRHDIRSKISKISQRL
jgi:hypothetical protein